MELISGPSLQNAVGDASLFISEFPNCLGTSGALTKKTFERRVFCSQKGIAWETWQLHGKSQSECLLCLQRSCDVFCTAFHQTLGKMMTMNLESFVVRFQVKLFERSQPGCPGLCILQSSEAD